MVKKKYRVKLNENSATAQMEARWYLGKEDKVPYDEDYLQIESDGIYHDYGTDKESAKYAEKYGRGIVEEYYRRQRSNRGKRYSTKNNSFDINRLVF